MAADDYNLAFRKDVEAAEAGRSGEYVSSEDQCRTGGACGGVRGTFILRHLSSAETSIALIDLKLILFSQKVKKQAELEEVAVVLNDPVVLVNVEYEFQAQYGFVEPANTFVTQLPIKFGPQNIVADELLNGSVLAVEDMSAL